MQRLDTHALKDLTSEEAKIVSDETGMNLRFERRIRKVIAPNGSISTASIRAPIFVDHRCLKLDTLIETQDGEITLEQFWHSEHRELRCQATLRSSSSWNGKLGLHKNFSPFLFDNGTRTKYVLSPSQLVLGIADAWIARLARMSPDQIFDCWTDKLRFMSQSNRERVVNFVGSRPGADDKSLKAALKNAEVMWKQQDIVDADEKLVSHIKDEGRLPIIYDPAELPTVLQNVEDKLFSDEENDIVLAHTQGLVTVAEKRATTVREVIRENENDGQDAPIGLLIDRYKRNALGLRVAASCAFLRPTPSGLKPIAPPVVVLDTMLEVSFKKAPALVGIIDHPAVLADGSLVQGHHFDPGTGFYTRVSNDLAPNLPDQISREMAEDAYRWIVNEALADFPFASDLDLAGAVALIFTTIQRRLMTGMEGAPIFAVSAPIQSSGKTALVRLASYLTLGTGVPVTSWPHDEEEMSKHLLAILMEGLPLVLFDNLPEGGTIESNELAKAVTAEKYRRRILGENKEGEAPTNVVWCFTGNNIQPVGDFNTRTILIYLDPNSDSPDRRSFSRTNLEEWCLRHRAEFYRHSMTILAGFRRHLLSSNGNMQDALGRSFTPTRFQDFDQQVRAPMIWAGAPDPAALFDRNKSADPLKESREILLKALHEAYGSAYVKIKKILDDCDQQKTVFDPHLTALCDALVEFTPSGGMTSRSLAEVFKAMVNQWHGDYCLKKKPQSENSKTSANWIVETHGDGGGPGTRN